MIWQLMIFFSFLLAAAYIVGKIVWDQFIKWDPYYYTMAYAAFASIALTVILVIFSLSFGEEDIYYQQTFVAVAQSIIALTLVYILYKRGAWKRIPSLLKNIKLHIAIASVCFILGIGAGVIAHEQTMDYVEQSLDSIEDTADAFSGKSIPELAVFLYGNNTRASLAIALGISAIPLIGAFYAVFAMTINGAIVGVVAMTIDKPLSYFLVGILPHGIFEIPAIVLAAATGMKINGLIVKGFLAGNENRAGNSLETLSTYIKKATELWDLLLLILALLIFAAIIESSITPWLLSGF